MTQRRRCQWSFALGANAKCILTGKQWMPNGGWRTDTTNRDNNKMRNTSFSHKTHWMLHLNVSNVNGHSSVSSFHKTYHADTGNDKKKKQTGKLTIFLLAMQLLPCKACNSGWAAQTVLNEHEKRNECHRKGERDKN